MFELFYLSLLPPYVYFQELNSASFVNECVHPEFPAKQRRFLCGRKRGLIWLLSFDILETVFTFRIVQQFIEIIIVRRIQKTFLLYSPPLLFFGALFHSAFRFALFVRFRWSRPAGRGFSIRKTDRSNQIRRIKKSRVNQTSKIVTLTESPTNKQNKSCIDFISLHILSWITRKT